MGYRFRLHRKDLPGRPDIVLPRLGLIVLVHGCFWHRHRACRLAKLPATNVGYWRTKLNGNVERDERAVKKLQMTGWRVLVVWECGTRGRAAEGLQAKLTEWIDGCVCVGEIPENVAAST